jgi:hypothetical protein
MSVGGLLPLGDRIPTPIAKGHRLAFGLLVAATATGIGWLALLPPFEGFDETAHYSYLQQLADTGRVPVLGGSYLSADVQAYRVALPTRYRDTPPFELNGGITYRAFRARPGDAATPLAGTKRRFAPSGEANWQSQHPPLYYWLLVPVYRLTREWSWPAQLFALRLISYLIAMAGLVLGAAATQRHVRAQLAPGAPSDRARRYGVVSLAWPFFVPMFFAEMARLGNDSLCLLIMGAVWWRLLAVTSQGRPSRRDAAVLGLLLGVGLLTKALFLPLALAVALFLAMRRQWRALAITLVVAAIVAAPWYAHAQATAGVTTGSLEHRLFVEQGGLRLLTERISLAGVIRGIASTFASFVWAGTWSLARPPEAWLLPPVALLLLVSVFFLVRLRKSGSNDALWLPILLGGCFAAGLLAHVALRIALTGTGVGTPGWYAHILAGPLGFAFATGIEQAFARSWARRLIAALSVYTIAYFAVVSWLQLALYTGCSAKLGYDKHYAFPDGPGCLASLSGLYERAEWLTYPGVGVPLLFGGLGLGALLILRLFRQPRTDATGLGS